ncbi:hypothetical protein B0T21DRAFT_344263 [Apiosordaria backusii]|uniref:Uncharacterized protein n=1 Tax=Apiosordaria backusii TaxID=314023 RepID=A0AA40F018_9PEZI|nr:hypothetical protein B0T21DRAFT_344263 [Apiosordaria backusii]
MPPIPLHTNSPINPAKASGITPQTASPGDPPSSDQPTPTKTTSLPPQNNNNGAPPPPQPGTIPHLPQVTPFPTAAQPAAPAPGITPAPTYPPVQAPPPETAIPAPERPYNQRGTATSYTPGSGSGSVAGAAVLPGPSPYEAGGGGYQGQGGGQSQGYQQRAGYQPSGGQVETEGEGGVLGSVMGYAKAAGEKLSEAEREVWRRINGEK